LIKSWTDAGSARSKLAAWLEAAVFVCLAAIALSAALSTKGAVAAFRFAIVLWLLLLCIGKRKLAPQPLAVPLFVFLSLTAISSIFSLHPALSWGRMRTISLSVLVIVVGQTLSQMRQVKILAGLLIASCILAVCYTAWQYTAGIGVQAHGSDLALGPLKSAGIVRGDIIREIGGKAIRSPADLVMELQQTSAQDSKDVILLRETPNALQPIHLSSTTEALRAGVLRAGVTLTRAHPPRAQGFFSHYFPFSEILVLIGLLMWGLVVSGIRTRSARITLVASLVATVLTLTLTFTRISLVGFLVGALLGLFMRSQSRIPWISVGAFALISLASLYWIQRHRGLTASDPGTEYRLLMWRDSVTLIRAHPLLGVGLDSIAGDWQRWNLTAYRRFGLHSHFHSTPIQLAVECGVPALAAWSWLIGAYAVFLLRFYRAVADQAGFIRGLVLGILGGLAAFVITGFIQYNLGDSEAMVVFWLLMGLAVALQRLVTRPLPSFSPE